MTTYPGGKNGSGVYQRIINLMPPHAVYVEPFLGGGAILRHKQPAPISSIAIDIDTAVIKAFTAHIPNLQLICGDAIEHLDYMKVLARPDTLIYCDPPYLMSTRSSQRPYYDHEFASEEEHIRLLRILRGLPCMVMISGYASTLYDHHLAGWRVETFQAMTRSGHTATEHVWLNFPEPMELHDYRWLGDTFRKRERIKRKQARWRARLASMDSQERYALLSVLGNLRPASSDMAWMANIDIFDDVAGGIAKTGESTR
jgi:site-specific DNA-adenine methylase